MSNITVDDVYRFLRKWYKAERFHLRDGNGWPKDYSRRIAESAFADLERYGKSVISKHESANGKTIWFDADLHIMSGVDDE